MIVLSCNGPQYFPPLFPFLQYHLSFIQCIWLPLPWSEFLMTVMMMIFLLNSAVCSHFVMAISLSPGQWLPFSVPLTCDHTMIVYIFSYHESHWKACLLGILKWSFTIFKGLWCYVRKHVPLSLKLWILHGICWLSWKISFGIQAKEILWTVISDCKLPLKGVDTVLLLWTIIFSLGCSIDCHCPINCHFCSHMMLSWWSDVLNLICSLTWQ